MSCRLGMPWQPSSSGTHPGESRSIIDGTPRAILLSFDLDGTLEDGDPPGPLSMSLPREALALGYVVGSASDRTLRYQADIWARRGIHPDFVSHKHTLDQVAAEFPALRRVHIGDTAVDALYARLAGFEFVLTPSFPDTPTLAALLKTKTKSL